MDVFLTGLKTAIDTLGATVLLPIVIFIIAVVLGAKVGRAFRAAVTIGVAFIGINLVLGLMLGSIGDVAQAIVTNTGIKRDIVDVGWPSAAAIAFGSSVGLWIIPIGIAVLAADPVVLQEIRQKGVTAGCDIVDFPVQGQQTKDYAAFREAVAQVPTDALEYVGVALVGERKPISKIVAKLGLLN